jgi:Histone acetylation protein/Bromodomain
MANGSMPQSDSSPRHRRLSIRVSSLKINKPSDHSFASDGTASESEPSPKGTPEIPPKPAMVSSLARQVSHEGLNHFADNDAKQPAAQSPVHCVSEFDQATISSASMKLSKTSAKFIPHHPNPLHNPALFTHHINALRLEATLHPLRLILSRLMTNLTYNRKGTFNTPVDPVALGLPDYLDVIQQPMDLGTVKNRLHSVAYQSRLEVANDIRLCFRNAMKYNPPQNGIHVAAKELLLYFEDQLRSFCPEIADMDLLNSVEPLPVDGEFSIPQPLFGSDPTNHDPAMAMDDSVEASSHIISTRTTNPHDSLLHSSHFTASSARKRKKRGSKMRDGHSCQWCHGNVCAVCEQACLPLQPTLLICNGAQCIGAKIRKGANYFIAPDGSSQYCQRCYAGLPAVLPQSGKHDDLDVCRYKRNLLKRKNDEEVVEHWLTCVDCSTAVHRMCALHNPYVHDSERFRCPSCLDAVSPVSLDAPSAGINSALRDNVFEMYTFVAGADLPVPLSSITNRSSFGMLCAEALPETGVSRLIEEKVRQRMIQHGCRNSEKTVVVRVISECDRYYKVPEVIRKHFRMQSSLTSQDDVVPPSKVMYHSKAIALFQKIDGLDVCIFCMYVQEYNGSQDEFDSVSDKENSLQERRVYIAYLDSVEHFRPRTCRTAVYQEVLTAYLASARLRGYETAHIWACPPSRGNSFVFWNHPAAQRTPNMERLTSWYHSALSRAIDYGVVTDVHSLFESDFEEPLHRIEEFNGCNSNVSVEMRCPPLLEGDFWIEEGLRIHALTLSRLSKEKSVPVDEAPSTFSQEDLHDSCPAVQIASMFRENIITHPLSKAFRRPVNAAALKLSDYHNIITKPMDLGTVHSRCVLGEYRNLNEFVADVNLVFSNAKKFNPPGHIVHSNAIELSKLFEMELNRITEKWLDPDSNRDEEHSWKVFGSTIMSLSHTLPFFEGLSLVESPSVKEGIDVIASLSMCSSSKDGSAVESSASANPVDAGSGPQAIRQKMVGSDIWLLEKKIVIPPNSSGALKNSKKGRKNAADSIDEPAPKRRRQTWLGEEVGVAVRRMRTSFFRCSLIESESEGQGVSPQSRDLFHQYVGDFVTDNGKAVPSSRVADARHALLEFSQFRSLEFDTLRRAKYSSAILLYHLHHEDAPGLIPECTTCGLAIEFVRWHRVSRVIENRPAASLKAIDKSTSSLRFMPEELCSSCYSKNPNQNHFIPLQVSI